MIVKYDVVFKDDSGFGLNKNKARETIIWRDGNLNRLPFRSYLFLKHKT